MFKMAVGQGECVDTGCATQAAIDGAREALGGFSPMAGVLFVGEYFDHEDALNLVLEAFPGIALAGCSSSGEFSTARGYSDDSIVLTLFASDCVRIRAGVVRDFAGRAAEAVDEAVAKIADFAADPPELCLIFPDMAAGSAECLVTHLSKRLPERCAIIGGAAGGRMDKRGSARQYFGPEILTGSAPFLFFSGPIEYAAGLGLSWRPVGVRGRVSESSGVRVGRIGSMPALDFYRHYLGPHSTPAFETPLAVYEEDGRHFHIRSPGGYNEKDRSIDFVGGVPEGAMVQLTEVTRGGLEHGVRKTVEILAAHEPGAWRPAGLMVFSCITRKLVLGTKAGDELRILRDGLPKGTPVAGFYCFSEIGPARRGAPSGFHSCTLAAVYLGEAGAGTPGLGETVKSPKGEEYCGDPLKDPLDAMRRENLFLRRQLDRCKSYRERLEYNKDQNVSLLRVINREVNEARLEITRKNKLLREALSLAEEVQRDLLPSSGPDIPGFDVAGASIYSDETGGDYFDFIKSPCGEENDWAALVGDVTGHGISAALLMTTARALLRMRFSRPGPLSLAVGDVNRHLSGDLAGTGRFMTLFALILDPAGKRMRWIRAGHDRMIVFDPATGEVSEIMDQGGIPLGVMADVKYVENWRTDLTPGQIYLLGTDGIWETHDPRRAMFGKERTYTVLRENAHKSAAEIVEAMFEALAAFRGRGEREDDATLTAIKVLGG